MVLTTLGRNAARCSVLGRTLATKNGSLVPPAPAAMVIGAGRRFAGYDYNQGWPGSRIKNPAPHLYDDVYPSMGKGWWTLIGAALLSFFYSQTYDIARPVKIDIAIFGPNVGV
mmetsp:Transcript_24190/g.45864  ORF Transcript_24190/g.45864 Transcript_24190/m.45864 type:complete len:113 (+) Transcript_24190:53-391(+)